MRIVFVHGACVKDGSWWWHLTGELLAEQGLASEAPALPSCGGTGRPGGAGGRGGGVEALRHLLLGSSYLPEVGQSLSSFGGEEPAPFLDVDPEGGTFSVRPDALAGHF